MFKRRFLSMLSLLLVLSSAALLHAQAYTSIVVFGDSLSDTGNFANLSVNAYALQIPGPIADYTAGRFTDGNDTVPAAHNYTGVWIEQLAASLAAAPAVKDSLDGGTNHAYGSATNSGGTQVVFYGPGNALTVTVENVGQQIADYLATKPTITNKTLFVVWCGANDLLTATSQAAIVTAANNDVANVQALITAGATDIIVPNLPPLGAIPRLNGSAATSVPATAAAQGYNAALAAGLAGLGAANPGKTLHLYSMDTFSLFNSILATPSVTGFANVTVSSQLLAVNPDTYLFWDDLHPTTYGHHLLAMNAKNLLTATAASTTALTLGAAAAIPGQTVSLQAVVTPTAAGTQPTPTGLVTFYAGGTAVATAALNSAGTATASLTAGAVIGSPYAITAQYAGDATYVANVSAGKTLSVLQTPVMTTTVVTSSNLSANFGLSITFTATVSSALGPATGSVTFYDGTTMLGTGTLTAGSTTSTATYTTSALAVGTHSITAVYGVSTNFAGSTSVAISQVVVAPSIAFTASPTSMTVLRGTTGATTLTLTPAGGFTGAYSLNCGTLPAHLSCTFSPATLTVSSAGGAQSSSLAIGTASSAGNVMPELPGRRNAAPVFAAFAFLPMLGGVAFLGRKRKQMRSLGMMVVLVLLSAGALLGMTGCGSSSNDAATGTYQVQANAVSTTGGATQSVTITVTVQ